MLSIFLESRRKPGTLADHARMRARMVLLGIAVGASRILAAEAADPSTGWDAWRVSGFGTVGVVHADTSQPWLYARDLTQNGAASDTSMLVDSRLGLQLNWQPNAQWDAVFQVVGRPRTRNADWSESVELGFLAYRPAPGWTISLGRMKPDLFLLHNARNVGFSMPWVRPNGEFYGWIPSASLDGAGLSYRWQQHDAQWAAQFWMGELRNTITVLRTDTHAKWRGRNNVGVTLTRESNGLTLKASFLQSDTDLGTSADQLQLEGALLGLSQVPVQQVAVSAEALYRNLIPDGRTTYVGLGAEYDSSTWLANAELSRVTMRRGLSGGTRGYASLGYRWGSLVPYAMAGFSQPEHGAPRVDGDWIALLTPVLGSAEAQAAAMAGAYAEAFAADARFDQRSLSMGLRWEARDRLALKLQIDRINVDAYGAGQWRHSTPDPGHVNLLSVTADWVF
jgi:hypothetical protein